MSADPKPPFRPFVPPEQSPPELTVAPLVVGSLLGVVFGASSMYLVLKVGLTVSASIPVAVLAFALFKFLSGVGLRRPASILENNTVQTAGSAGESIAFAVGLVMPALLLLGFDIDVVKVMTVGVLGSLLGILMMIPLRRAFIVQKHGELKYPEGTACAEVLIAGEKGGSTARMVLIGFGLGFVYRFLMGGVKLWKGETHFSLAGSNGGFGLKGASIGAEMDPALVGVGYIIGPRIAGIMVAGGVLAYLVITPTIAFIGGNSTVPVPPAQSSINTAFAGVAGVSAAAAADTGLIRNMDEGAIRSNYILFIGAGAVAAGGIISMVKALPVIVGSMTAALRDLRAAGQAGAGAVPRTERDLPFSFILFGALGLVLAVVAAPSLGLGFNPVGLVGAAMILLFGFLFVTVSSRLTGEIGSSSNPISGMTVATLLLTCLGLLALSQTGLVSLDKSLKLVALTVAGVVCVACSNGGTTSQALKTGHLLGATPRNQQLAIIVGSLTSALVVGLVLLAMNQAGTVYTKQNLPAVRVDPATLPDTDTVRSGPYKAEDGTTYKVLNVGEGERYTALEGGAVPAGRYLVGADGRVAYRVDPAINGAVKVQDNGESVESYKFVAPKTQLIGLIINGIFDRNLPWDLVLIGVLIAVTLELSGVPSLPFAVGVYLQLGTSMAIFLGGMVRWLADRLRPGTDGGDSSPGVLLSSGYIAGASIMAVILAFLALDDSKTVQNVIDQKRWLDAGWTGDNLPAVIALGVLMVVLLVVGSERVGQKRGG
jgi:OPT family oligopeptide transporter